MNTSKLFNTEHVLHELKHYLPSQTPLKDFIHHNSLHAFQGHKFYEALFTASEIFGYKISLTLNEYRKLYQLGRIRKEILNRTITAHKGEGNIAEWMDKLLKKSYSSPNSPRIGKLRAHWKTVYKIDLDNRVQPLLFRVICSYLDQGVALWHFPYEDKGLINALRIMEKNSFTSFFKTKRARQLLLDEAISIEKLLGLVVGKEAYFEEYLFDQQFAHRGWSGIVGAIEDNPSSILYPKNISLNDFILFELLLEIDALDHALGKKWFPLAIQVTMDPVDLFAKLKWSEWHEVLMMWQDAFEWSYYDDVLAGVSELQRLKKVNKSLISEKPEIVRPSFQAVFCIDERECSFRRHLEEVQPDFETLACPGFFGVEFYFHPANGKFYEKLCPAPVTPKYLIKEKENNNKRHHELLFAKKSHTLVQGFMMSLALGGWAVLKLVSHLFRPKMSPAISNAFSHMHLNAQLIIENKDTADKENGLQVGFTIQEMADRVEALLRGIGMISNFASLIYVIAHGSSSANNPHHGAYNCGACSGRPGSVNARVFAFMANHPYVRINLSERGLHIPSQTQFIGALHNTTSDEMAFYDVDLLSELNAEQHKNNKITFETALDLNAKERSRRFSSINTTKNVKHVREAIRKRSVSYFEPRPELGHGTNALCFVGQRKLTKGLFLDRRAFMNSYDYRTDTDGKFLLNVMKPLPPVCGGINLEYYFSRVDNYKLGAGTKLPHNIMGLIGVANSSDGDLRPGLSLQMIEVHDPVRLMIIVEHYPEVVLNVIRSSPEMYEWFINEWVHLIAIHPVTNEFYYFKKGVFELYKPLAEKVNKTNNVHELIESVKEMETNEIIHATQENIPVHLY